MIKLIQITDPHLIVPGETLFGLDPLVRLDACLDHIAAGLILRHDHGSNDRSNDFQREVRFLGITRLPAFVRQPEGNGVAERAIRTLKEQLLWVKHFATVEELRLAPAEFAALSNASWPRQRHGHKTPDQIRAEQISLETEAATVFKLAA